MAAAELSVHVRGIAEKLRKRAEDAAKKGGIDASAGLLASVEHLLQSADLMERQHQLLQMAGSLSSEPMSTTLRNLQLVGAMLEKKSEEMRNKQAMGPANSLAQSASHVRIGVQRLEAIETWLASTLGDTYTPEMDWSAALSQVPNAQAKTGNSETENALKDAEARVVALEAELTQWKQHHEATQAQQLQLLEQLEQIEVELSLSKKSQHEVAGAKEALEAELSVAHDQIDALAAQLDALKTENATAEQEMQEEWERLLKQSEALAKDVAELRAKDAASQQLVQQLHDRIKTSQDAMNMLEKELDEMRGKESQTEKYLKAKTDQVAHLSQQLVAAQEKLHSAEHTMSTVCAQNDTSRADAMEALEAKIVESTTAVAAAQSSILHLEAELAACRAQYHAALESHELQLTAAEDKALSTIHSLEKDLVALRDNVTATTAAHEKTQAELGDVHVELAASVEATEKALAELEDTQEQLAASVDSNDRTMVELEETQIQLAASTDLIEANRLKIESLERELDERQSTLEALEAQLSAAATSRRDNNHDSVVESLKTELADVRAQLATVHGTADSLTADLVSARRQLVAAEELAAINQDTIETLEDELVAVRRQAEEAVQTAGSWELELVAVRDGIARLEAQLTSNDPSNNHDRNRSSSSIGGVESVSSVGDKLTLLATAIRLLNEEKGQFHAQIERLEASVAQEQATVLLHAEQVRALELHVENAHQLHQEMRTTHEEEEMARQEHGARLKDEVAGLRAEKERWIERAQALELEVQHLTQTVADLSATSLNENDSKLLELSKQVHALEASKTQLLEQLETAKATATSLEAIRQELLEQMAGIQDENAHLEEQLKASQDDLAMAKDVFETEKFDWQAQQKVMEEQFVQNVQDLKKQVAAKDAELLTLHDESRVLLENARAGVVAATEGKGVLADQLRGALATAASTEESLRVLQEQHTAAIDEWTMTETALTQEKVSLKNLSDELAARVAELEDDIVQLNRATTAQLATEATMEELSKKTAQFESQVAWLDQELASVRANLLSSEEAKADLLAELQAVQGECAAKVQALVDQVNVLVTEKTAWQAAASARESQWQDQFQALEQAVQTLTDEKLRLMEDHDRHIEQLKHDYETAAKAAASCSDGSHEDKVGALTCELAIVSEEAKASALELQSRIKQLEDERETLVEAQRVHAVELRDLSDRLKAGHVEILQKHVDTLTKEHAVNIQRLEEQLDALVAEKAHLQTDRDGLTASQTELEADKAALADELRQVRAALTQHAADIGSLVAQKEALETEKLQAVARYEAEVTTWQARVNTLQKTHASEIETFQRTIDELEATKSAAFASDGARQAAMHQERDNALVQLKDMQTAFEEYKTRAAAALKKAEKRTALLNPMLAEKQQLETQLATLQEYGRHVRETHENALLNKEEIISRLTAAIEDAARASVPKEKVQAVIKVELETATADLHSQLQATGVRVQELEASLATKDAALAAAAVRLEQVQHELTALNETLELKSMLVTKAMSDKESFEASIAQLQEQLDEALAKLSAVGETESKQRQERSAELEATLLELTQQKQAVADLERQIAEVSTEMNKAAILDAALVKMKTELVDVIDAKAAIEAKYQDVVAQRDAALSELHALRKTFSNDGTTRDDSASCLERIAQLEAEKAALDEAWRLKLADLERTHQELIDQHAQEKTALVASLQKSSQSENGQVQKSTEDSSTDDTKLRELQLLLAQKDAALADLSSRLEVEAANEKMAFEATKLLTSQLEEKNSYVQLLKQNAELQLRQATQDAQRQLADQRHTQQVEHDAAIAALKAQFASTPSHDDRGAGDATHRQLGQLQAKVAALTAENESLLRQVSAVSQLQPPPVGSNGTTPDAASYQAQIQNLQLENTHLMQSVQSLRETLNEKLQQLATLKAPVHTKMLDELERTIEHEKRALMERKDLHVVHMTKLKLDAEVWLDEAQAKLDEHAALQDALAKDISAPVSADDIVVNPLEVTLVLKSGVVIKAGSSFDLPVVVSAGQTIQWSFRIEELDTDVNFALTFNGDTDVIPVNRVERLQGTFQAKASGVLKFEWDNAFSWLNPKTLDYHVSVFEPLSEAALQKRKTQEMLATQIKQLNDKIEALANETALLATFDQVIGTKVPSAIELYLEECMAHREMVVCPKLSQVQDKMTALKALMGLYIQEQQDLTEATAALTMLLDEIHQEQRDLQNTCHLHKNRKETLESLQATLCRLEAQVSV